MKGVEELTVDKLAIPRYVTLRDLVYMLTDDKTPTPHKLLESALICLPCYTSKIEFLNNLSLRMNGSTLQVKIKVMILFRSWMKLLINEPIITNDNESNSINMSSSRKNTNKNTDYEEFCIALNAFLESTLQDATPVQAIAKKVRLTILNYCQNLKLVKTALDAFKTRSSMLKYEYNNNNNSNKNQEERLDDTTDNNNNNDTTTTTTTTTTNNNNNSISSMTSTPEKSKTNTSTNTTTNVVAGHVMLTGRSRSRSQNSSLEKELEDKVFRSSSLSPSQVVPPSPIASSPAIGSIPGSPIPSNQFDTFDFGAGTSPGSASPLLSSSPLLRLGNMSLYDDSKWHGPQVVDGIVEALGTAQRGRSASDDTTSLFSFERRQLLLQQQQQSQSHRKRGKATNITSTLPRWLVVPGVLHRKLVMDVFTPIELADALTALDWELWMASIYPSELLGLTWTKRTLKTVHPISGGAAHIQRLIQATNQTVVWVATEILHASMEYARGVECISFFVATARQAFKLNNFNAMFVLISALGLPAIRNLKTCWAYIRPSVRKLLEALRSMCSPSSNYTLYRKAISEIKGEPIIPVFQVALRDLTFVENAGSWFATDDDDAAADDDELKIKEGCAKLEDPKIIDVRKIIATADILDSMCQYGLRRDDRVELKIMEVDGTSDTEIAFDDRESRISFRASHTSYASRTSRTSSIGSHSSNFSVSTSAPSSYSICIEPCRIPFHESELAALTAKAMALSRQHDSNLEPIDIKMPYYEYTSGSPVPAPVRIATPEDPIAAIAKAKANKTEFDPYAGTITTPANGNINDNSPRKRIASADAKQLAGAGLRYSLPAIPSFLAVKQLYTSSIFELIPDNDNDESLNNNNSSNVTHVAPTSINGYDTSSNVNTGTTTTTGSVTYSPGWKKVAIQTNRNQSNHSEIGSKQKKSHLDSSDVNNNNNNNNNDDDIDRTSSNSSTARKLFSPEQSDGLLDTITNNNVVSPTGTIDGATTTSNSNSKSDKKRSTWEARGSRTSVRKKWGDPQRFEIHVNELLVSWLLGVITNSRLEIDDLWHIGKQAEKIESVRHLASVTK